MKKVLLLAFTTATLFSCKKNSNDVQQDAPPTVSTTAATSITGFGAVSGGNVTADGGFSVTSRGVCWSTSSNPTIADNNTNDGSGKGAFASNITGLARITKYYMRAYATNAKGTAYGDEKSFTTSGPTVFVAGGDSNKACVWINGTKAPLTDGSGTSLAKSVLMSGNDIYVAGVHAGIAKIWKNGVASPLPSSSYADVVSLFVVGSDVYAGGSDDITSLSKPKVWKNGVALSMQTSTYGGWVNSLYVSGSDVYAGGAYYQTQNKYTPAVWKNGVVTLLSSNQGYVTAVWYLGSDLYAVGEENDGTGTKARIWKNGVPTILSNEASGANALFISGSDIYIGGYQASSGGMIWKNGAPITIPNISSVMSLYIDGNDVYAAGSRTINNVLAVSMVKNGVATPLTDGTGIGRCFSIFVK